MLLAWESLKPTTTKKYSYAKGSGKIKRKNKPDPELVTVNHFQADTSKLIAPVIVKPIEEPIKETLSGLFL